MNSSTRLIEINDPYNIPDPTNFIVLVDRAKRNIHPKINVVIIMPRMR